MQRTRLVARNIATTLATQVVSSIATLFVTLYVPRYIGAIGLGKLTFAGSYAAIFGLIAGIVSSTVLVREIARRRDAIAEMVCNALFARVALTAIAVLAGSVFSYFAAPTLRFSQEDRWLFFLSLMLMMPGGINDVLGSALRGLEEVPKQNAAALVEKLLSSALTIVLVLHHASLYALVSVGFASSIASFWIYWSGLRPYMTRLVWPTWRGSRGLAISSLPFLTTAVFIAVYGQCDAQLLHQFSSDAAIGWYGLAKRLGGACMFIPTAVSTAMLPTMARLYAEDREIFDKLVRRFIGYMFLLVVPFASVLIFAPMPLLHLMHYPSSFDPAAPVLVILGCVLILWFLTQATATALIASDRQGVLSRATGMAALLSVPSCAGLVYLTQFWQHNGAIGAMVSDAIVEVYMAVVYIAAMPKGCVAWRQLEVLGKSAIAAAPIVAPLYFIHGARWGLLATVPGLIAYLPLAYALGCIDHEDVGIVKQMLARKVNSGAAFSTGEMPNTALDNEYSDAASPVAEQRAAASIDFAVEQAA
jgi:O-antigen/teichoic acid export membrane protein